MDIRHLASQTQKTGKEQMKTTCPAHLHLAVELFCLWKLQNVLQLSLSLSLRLDR